MKHFVTSYFVPLLALTALLLLSFYHKRAKSPIITWRKSLNLETHEPVFHQLFAHSNGFILSQQARAEKDALEYVYGEIEFTPFIALLSLAQPDNKTIFYDLGSGIGKAVIAAAMVYPIKKSVGVELFPQLQQEALNLKKQLANKVAYQTAAQKIEFILGDFLKINLDEATLIFINATSLFQPTWGTLCAILEQLPHLRTIITTSKPLPSKAFRLIRSTKVEMSWGVVVAYIHEFHKDFQTNCVEKIE